MKMSQADTYCTERYWCPVGVSVRSSVTCPCWNSSQANSAASAPHYHLLCRLIWGAIWPLVAPAPPFLPWFLAKVRFSHRCGCLCFALPRNRPVNQTAWSAPWRLSPWIFSEWHTFLTAMMTSWRPRFFFFFLNGGFFHSPLFWTLLVYDSKCKCDSMNLLKAK